MTTTQAMVTLTNIVKRYPILGGVFKRQLGAVSVLNGITLSIPHGEITGLVGESGCGKSTLAKLLMKLEAPSSGSMRFEGISIPEISGRDQKRYYRRVQMIFQDPFASLNPRMKVKDIIGEMIRIQGVGKATEKAAVLKILNEVELDPDALNRYPHEFSGGQRQRIAIARALIVEPDLLIADEPVSALDLSLQAKTMSLLRSLKQKHQLTILLISHDLKRVASFCDTVAVMYLGRIVEQMPGDQLLKNFKHPYTEALISSIPATHPDNRKGGSRLIQGEVPSPLHLPSGCAFHNRCPRQMEKCAQIIPDLHQLSDRASVACHLYPESD